MKYVDTCQNVCGNSMKHVTEIRRGIQKYSNLHEDMLWWLYYTLYWNMTEYTTTRWHVVELIEVRRQALKYAKVYWHTQKWTYLSTIPEVRYNPRKNTLHMHTDLLFKLSCPWKNNAFVPNIWSVLPCTTHIVMYYKLFQNIAECTRIWGHVVKLINVPKQTLRVKAYINENIATYAKVKNVSVKESQILIPFTQEPVTNARWTT